MNGLLTKPNRAVALAADQLEDAAVAAATAHTVTVRMLRQPQEEVNRVQFLVSITPVLLDSFCGVAFRRTYEWLRLAYQLPPGLPGTVFAYNNEPYEFKGASTRPAKPGAFFLIVRSRDNQQFWCSPAFIKKRVVAVLATEAQPVETFSIGLGPNEVFFPTS